MAVDFKRGIGVVASAVILGGMIYWIAREQSLDRVLELWQRLGFLEISAALLIGLVVHLATAWRVRVILSVNGVSGVTLFTAFRLQLVALFVSHGTPIAALGDVAKVVITSLWFQMTAARALKFVIFERIIGAGGAVCIGAACVWPAFLIATPSDVLMAQAALWALGLVGMAALVVAGRVKIFARLPIVHSVWNVIASFSNMLTNPRNVAKLLLGSLIQLGGLAAIFVILSVAMELQISPIAIFVMLPTVFFVSSLPVFYQGWGAREVIFYMTVGAVSALSAADAAALSIAVGGITFATSLLGAVIWLLNPTMRQSVTAEMSQLRMAK